MHTSDSYRQKPHIAHTATTLFVLSPFFEPVVKAYQFTSITSVTLLDCWTIPWVIILTRIFIKTKYIFWQIVGVATSIAGLVLVLFSDVSASDGGGSKPILGDALVIAGTIFYAISNVGEEFCVKKRDRVEVVAMLGTFGAVISACQLYPYCCLPSWSNVFCTLFKRLSFILSMLVLLFFGFGVSMFAFYTFAPCVLKMSGSTLFNLSLLTSDMWAVVIRIFFYHQAVDWLYYVAFGVVAVGLAIYSYHSDKVRPSPNSTHQNDLDERIPYTQLDEESVPSSQNINEAGS